MRVRVVRTVGEIRDTIGHKVMVKKGWEGEVVQELSEKEILEHGYHPKRKESYYLVQFDDWSEPIAVPANHLIVLSDEE